jgi:hypothetical protein
MKIGAPFQHIKEGLLTLLWRVATFPAGALQMEETEDVRVTRAQVRKREREEAPVAARTRKCDVQLHPRCFVLLAPLSVLTSCACLAPRSGKAPRPAAEPSRCEHQAPRDTRAFAPPVRRAAPPARPPCCSVRRTEVPHRLLLLSGRALF